MACASWIAVTPMPDEPPLHQQRLLTFKASPIEDIAPDGIEGLRQACGLDETEAFWHRQTLRQGCCAVFSVAAALHQGANLRADLELRAAAVASLDGAGDLEPWKVRGARRHRIVAGALKHVRAVDASGCHLDQNLACFSSGFARSRSCRTSGLPGVVISDDFHAFPSS